jgi:hypothetical protein
MSEMRSNYTMSPGQMPDWTNICLAFADKIRATLLFVNETSCGVEFDDGSFKHIYIDEMMDYLKQEIK